MLHSKESTVVDGCDNNCPKRSTIAIPRQNQQEGQSSGWNGDQGARTYRGVLENRGVSRE